MYLKLRKIVNARGNTISISLKVEICFVFSEIGIEADCEELERKIADDYILKTKKCLKKMAELEAITTSLSCLFRGTLLLV